MTKKQKKQLYKILISLLFLILAAIFSSYPIVSLIMYLASYFVIGFEILKKAVRNIINGQVFDENFLMSIATVGAMILGEYQEGVAVMVFYQIGELFQSYAVNKSRRSIAGLMDIRPDIATVVRDGVEEDVDPYEVSVGETIVVRPGDKIPLDGIVLEGNSSLDTAALTGESIPREVGVGDNVISGCINKNGVLYIEVIKEFDESTVSKILELVENASSNKAPVENFITKFARYYTPAVVIAAVLLAIIPPIFIHDRTFGESIYQALTFLVISCPCALVISIPLSFFGGIGGASKAGILIKGSCFMEALAQAEIAVFDKTGTLTKGAFQVTEIHSVEDGKEEELLEMAAHCEQFSTHPIATALCEAYKGEIDKNAVTDVEEVAGFGLKALVFGRTVCAGNYRFMERENIAAREIQALGTIVYVAEDGIYKGCIVIADQIREDAKEAIAKLKQCGIKKTVMLTGDVDYIGRKVAEKLGIDEVHTQLLPRDKVDCMEQLVSQTSVKGKLIYTGDGINDAPVLTRANVGIAMGGLGSDAAIEAADIVIMTDEPSKIATAIQISRKTLRICWQNIVFALGVKAIIMILGAVGYASMWAAVFADVGVAVIAILNAIRALHVQE